MDAQVLLRRAVEARIKAWDHPFIDERDTAADEVGLMLQEVVRERLPQAVPVYSSLDGVKELSARTNAEHGLSHPRRVLRVEREPRSDAAVEADLSVALGALSVVSVGGEESEFEIPAGERQFARRMVGGRTA